VQSVGSETSHTLQINDLVQKGGPPPGPPAFRFVRNCACLLGFLRRFATFGANWTLNETETDEAIMCKNGVVWRHG
jgi:hypothetical protein